MLTLINTTVDEDGQVHKEYACDFIAECDGTSLWSDTTGKKVHVTGIDTFELGGCSEGYVQVDVGHDANWEIYTDKGFARAVSEALGYEVYFTEQGMQDDNFASMEHYGE
jgi:hypothetical protein